MTAAIVHRLRGYQVDAIKALELAWQRGLRRIGIGLPTGTGKTHVMVALAADHAAQGDPVLVLVHRDTLVIQTEEKMRAGVHPGTTVGVVKADRDVVGADVVVASVHTLRTRTRLDRIRTPGLIIVDEAHVSMSDTYAAIFARFPHAKVAGFTATWVRSDKRQLGDFWEEIVFQRSIRWAIREGHLVPPRGIEVGAPADLLDGVRTRGGDYVESDLGAAVSVEQVRTNVVTGYREHADNRSAVLFAPTRAAAEYMRSGLLAAGIPAAGVYALTSSRDRRAIFAGYRKREISVLTTCTALAEGWDAPWCSVALMVRPTKHVGLYIQQVGRVLRPWPGKSDALVLDFVGGAQGMSLSLDAALKLSEPPSEKDDAEERELLDGADDQELMFRVRKGTNPVDLFAGTEVKWLTTNLGVQFVATQTRLYFLCPVDGAWSVGECSIDTLKGGRWLKSGLSSGEALAYASIVAVDDDPQHTRLDADWRKASRKPTPEQVRYARSIGVVFAPSDSRGDLADLITLRRASVTLRKIGEVA